MNTAKTMRHLLSSIAIFSICATSYAEPPLPSPVGRVVWVKGSLKATMPNKEERLLQKSSVIYEHDTLTTDASSQAEIAFTDNTLMTFRESTKFSVDQYSYNAQSKSGSVGKYVTTLIEGGFRTITGLIAKSNPVDYQVNTPVATIGVRGTEYSVYLQDGKLFMLNIHGAPLIKTANGIIELNDKLKYAWVPYIGAKPEVLEKIPNGFRREIRMDPYKATPFIAPPGVSGPPGGSGGIGTGGVVSSFCIQ